MVDRLNSIVIIVVCWAFFAFLALWTFSLWPKTLLGWLLTLVVGPVVFIVVQALGEGFCELIRKIPFLKKTRNEIEIKTKNKRTSLTRINYLFFELIIFLAIFGAALYLLHTYLGDSLDPVFNFFNTHFK
jgi:hypothetical protein